MVNAVGKESLDLCGFERPGATLGEYPSTWLKHLSIVAQGRIEWHSTRLRSVATAIGEAYTGEGSSACLVANALLRDSLRESDTTTLPKTYFRP